MCFQKTFDPGINWWKCGFKVGDCPPLETDGNAAIGMCDALRLSSESAEVWSAAEIVCQDVGVCR